MYTNYTCFLSGSTEEVDDLRLALDKNKRLLALQSKISSDYKKELEILQNEIKERQKENENLKQILDMKNDKIKVSISSIQYIMYMYMQGILLNNYC